MTEEQIKAKAKEQFPNDEFDQQIVIDAINWATKELQEENERLKKGGCRLVNCNGRENGIELRKAKIKIEQLEKQIEKMKCCGNCKNTYTRCYHDGFRCKDHAQEEVCKDWEFEGYER